MMALPSSWVGTTPFANVAAPALGPGTPSLLPTVLMSVRVMCPRMRVMGPTDDGGGGCTGEEFRLQLSMDPERSGGGFRLSLRQGQSRGPAIAEFNLKDVSYQVQNPRCHQLSVLGQPEDLIFNFEDVREAQKWWTIVSSSIREVQKAANNRTVANHTLPQPLIPVVGNPFQPMSSELSTSLIASTGNPFPTDAPDKDCCAPLFGISKTEDLATRLCKAIELGDLQSASQYAVALASHQSSLQIQLKQSVYQKSEISMKVGVEDAASSVNITIQVHAYTTLSTLKQQVFHEYGFHPSVQCWIIGQCLCTDDRTLGSYGIRKDGDTAFLYLLSARRALLSRQRYEDDQSLAITMTEPIIGSQDASSTDAKWKCSTLPSKLSRNKAPFVKKNGSNRLTDVDDITRLIPMDRLTMNNSPLSPLLHMPPQSAATLPSPVQVGWSCPTCTYINKPTRPGCEMCSSDRPKDYVIPEHYKPDELERLRMQQEKDGIQKYQKENGRREDGSAHHYDQNANSLDDFIHLSDEFS